MGYVIKIIVSWELSVEEVWILYWIISLMTLLASYNDLWMTESLKHFVPIYLKDKKYDKVKTILFLALFTQIVSALIIAAFFYFWASFIAENYFKTSAAKETLQVFAIFFIGLNIFQTLNHFFMAVQDTFYYRLSDLIRITFVVSSVIFIFLWDSSSLLFYSYSWLIWLYIWILFVLLVFYKKYYSNYLSSERISISREFISPVLKYAWFVFLWAGAWTLLWQVDMQMIIYILWTEQAWYYTNYLSIIWIPFLILAPIFGLLFPIFSEMYSKWQNDKIYLVKSIFQKNFILIAIAFNTFFFVFAQQLAYTLFWEKFIESWVILQYSILLLVFNFLFQINFNILAGIWKVKDRVKIVSIVLVFNIIMNILLINLIWVAWAALATWIWWMLIWILTEYYLGKEYIIGLDFKNIIKNIFIFWALWIWVHFYALSIFMNIWRIQSFGLLALFSLFYLCIFIWTNLSECKKLIWEIKKMKRKEI